MKKLIVLACVLLCGGCSSLMLGPDRVYTVDEQVTLLRTNPPLPPGTPQTAVQLNEYVTERMFEIDLEYNNYFAKLTTDSQTASIAGDATLLTLTALSTVAPASAVVYKTAYSAAATGVTGFKAAVDKDVLLSHTIQILQSQMEASRTLVRNRITANLESALKGTAPYTVWQALSDLEDYYRAGTLPGALEALASATGNNAQQAKDLKNGATQDAKPVQTTSLSTNSHGAKVRTLVPSRQ